MKLKKTMAGVGAIALLGTTVPLLGMSAASAKHDLEWEKTKRCSKGIAKLDVEIEKDGRWFEIDSEIERSRRGDVWNVRMYQNGKRFTNVKRKADRKGEVEVDRDRRNTKKQDVFTVWAKNQSTKEKCKVTIKTGH